MFSHVNMWRDFVASDALEADCRRLTSFFLGCEAVVKYNRHEKYHKLRWLKRRTAESSFR